MYRQCLLKTYGLLWRGGVFCTFQSQKCTREHSYFVWTLLFLMLTVKIRRVWLRIMVGHLPQSLDQRKWTKTLFLYLKTRFRKLTKYYTKIGNEIRLQFFALLFTPFFRKSSVKLSALLLAKLADFPKNESSLFSTLLI